MNLTPPALPLVRGGFKEGSKDAEKACPDPELDSGLNRACPEEMLKQVQHDTFGILNDTFRVQHDTLLSAFVLIFGIIAYL